MVAAATLGTAYGVTGTAINATTEIVNCVETGDYQKKIQSLLSRVNSQIEELQLHLEEYNGAVELLKKTFKLDSSVAWNLTNQFWKNFENISKNIRADGIGAVGILLVSLAMAKPCSGADIAVMTQFAGTTFNLVKEMPGMGVKFAPKVISASGNIAVKSIAKEVAEAGVTVGLSVKEMSKVGVKVSTQTVGKAVLTGALAGVNVGLAIIDIVSLVKCLNNAHPAVS